MFFAACWQEVTATPEQVKAARLCVCVAWTFATANSCFFGQDFCDPKWKGILQQKCVPKELMQRLEEVRTCSFAAACACKKNPLASLAGQTCQCSDERSFCCCQGLLKMNHPFLSCMFFSWCRV